VTARAPEGPAIRWKRALLWAFPLVVVSFVTATIISQLVAAAIDEAAGRIVTDYSPSVIALATARSDLHRIQDFVSDYVEGDERRIDRDRIAAAQAELDASVAAYLRLPFIAGERELWERVTNDIFAFRQTVDRTLAAVDRGDAAGARRSVRGDLRAAVDRASADILSDIELNGNAADADARLIAQRHRRSLQVAILLAIVSVTFTAIVARLVYRLGAQHDALQRRHTALLEEANAELEAFASRLSHDILSPLASTRLALEASLPVQGVVACNEGLLTAALSNLVRNAITHMDGEPGKRVDVAVINSRDRVRIEVRDNGPGLPPGTEATMFEPFVRGPGATHAGLGLGLATVKRIADTHGGAVGVDSRAGAGCRFWIELPRATAAASTRSVPA